MANPVKLRGIVENISEFDSGIYSIIIHPDKKIPRYRAGQFLHLTIDEYDPCGGFWPESRVFSIASAPESDVIEIVYSVKGHYTTRMCNELSPGKQVWLKLPYGDFSVETAAPSNADIILVAGGTGISPYIPYLKRVLANNAFCERKIHLVYGIRNVKHLLFSDVISMCAQGINGVSVDLFVESLEVSLENPGLIPNKGMISLEYLVEFESKMSDPVYFLSGPPQMITRFSEGLHKHGIEEDRIKIDAWE